MNIRWAASTFCHIRFLESWTRIIDLLVFPGGSVVKNLLAMQETRVWSLSHREDSLEKGEAAHSSIAWKMPWTEELGRLQSMRVGYGHKRVGHDFATKQQQYIGLQTQSTLGWILKLMLVVFDSGSGHWYGGKNRRKNHSSVVQNGIAVSA